MHPSENSPLVPAATSGDSGRAWWRFPFVWLVVGGPLLVVVASISTAVIAIRGADPVLDHDDSGGEAPVLKHAQPTSMTPALAARNNAATAKP